MFGVQLTVSFAPAFQCTPGSSSLIRLRYCRLASMGGGGGGSAGAGRAGTGFVSGETS